MHEVMKDLSDFWVSKIKRDLADFCDPGTQLQIENDRSSILCEMHHRGERKEFNLKLRPDLVTLTFKGNEYRYRDFLASSHLSDLRNLAKMIAQTSKPELYVETKVRNDDQKSEMFLFDHRFIERFFSDSPEYTQLLMITGEAGAGKSSALRNLVKKGAERFLNGESSYLFFYVNAQGRALSRFNEALSTELNELRSVIPYHAVSSLVRNDLLIPIVDGFDELLGISGSEDAFSSLSAFIEELDGQGITIASSRSSYFENEFRAKANQHSSLGSQSWRMRHCRILKWQDVEVDEYLRRFSEAKLPEQKDKEYFYSKIDLAFSSHPDLKYKPLFLSKVSEVISDGEDISQTEDLLSEIVNIQLNRECSEKILSKAKTPILTLERLSYLYSEIAEEMWNQEARELTKDTISFVAEYVLSEVDISNEHKEYVIGRLPSAAFMTPGDKKGSLAFEHEAFFDYFISERLASTLVNEESLIRIQSIFGRSQLSSELSSRLSKSIKDSHKKNLLDVMKNVNGMAAFENSRTAVVRENGGRIVSEFLSNADIDCSNIEIKNAIFPETDFGNCSVKNVAFKGCEFRKAKFSTAKITSSNSENSLFFESIVDVSSTRLEINGVVWDEEVIGLKFGEDEDPCYDPEIIYDSLAKIGIITVAKTPKATKRSVDETVLKMIEKFFNLYNIRNPICKGDEHLNWIFLDSKWRDLEKILIRHKIVTSEVRSMGGPPKEFLRRQVLPEEFLKGINKNANVQLNIDQAWSEIEAL